jgi:acyl carrier protein
LLLQATEKGAQIVKVIYWDVVGPEEIGTSEFRRELEIPGDLDAREAALVASELVDKADFAGVDSGIGQTATNYIQVGGEMFRVDKRVVVERRATPLETDPVPTKQLALPLISEPPPAQTPLSVEDRVFRVIRGYAQGDFDLSSQTRLDSIFDSVGVIEVSIGLEGEFGFDFAEDRFEEWATIDDVVKCVEKMLLSQGVAKPAPLVEHQRPGIW